ncbi:MAG: NADH-quinone oxidoreductase subunit C [Chloroflexota bacterium]
MDKKLKSIAQKLAKKFDGQLDDSLEQARVIVPSGKIVELCKELRDKHDFESLTGFSVVDYHPQTEPRFHLIYQFRSIAQNIYLEVRMELNGSELLVDSVTGIYPGVNWYEREAWDMFGIQFEGHPDLRRLLMPYDWEGHPLRKDYPLGYEEVQFTFNYDEIAKRKPSPKE